MSYVDSIEAQARETLTELLDELSEAFSHFADPAQSADAATRLMNLLAEARDEVAGERRNAVRRLRYSGDDEALRPTRSWAEVGAVIGVSGERAKQIAHNPAPSHSMRAISEADT